MARVMPGQAAPRVGGRPVVAVVQPGDVVPARIRLPLWMTVVRVVARAVWSVVSRLVAWAWLHPVAAVLLLVVGAIWVRWDGRTVAVAGAAATGVLLLVSVVWRLAWPSGWDRLVVARARGWWRWRWVYVGRWREVMRGCHLVHVVDEVERMPQVASVRSWRGRDVLVVRLADGQVPDDFATAGEAIGHALRAWRCTVAPDRPGHVVVTVWWLDPLAEVVTVDVAAVTVDAYASSDGPVSVQEASDDPAVMPSCRLTAEHVMARLSSVACGVREDGAVWTLDLRPGHHLLVAGTTGSGKSGLLWVVLWDLQDLIRAGWVRVTALDPKWVELPAAQSAGLAEVVVGSAVVMADHLEAVVAEMDVRCAAMTGRTHVPSLAEPVRLVVVDELATLTALADSKTRARIESALGHLLQRGRAAGFEVIQTTTEPTKEIVRWRGLCAGRVCCRTDDPQGDLALGDGSRDRGAATDLIPVDMPGIAYVREEGRASVSRVRIAYVSDDAIAALIRARTGVPVSDESLVWGEAA